MGKLDVRKEGAFYTLREEIANAVTHGLGSAFALAGGAVLIVFAALTHDAWKVVSASIYVGCMLLLFTMSTLYHAFTGEKLKGFFRKLDHTSIFYLIAGTYTPFTLVVLRGTLGWIMFAAVWITAIIGTVVNLINVDRFEKVSLIGYIVSGWVIVLAIVPLARALNVPGTVFLVLGGLMYTIGIIFYKMKNRKYMHSIWHVFVLAGAVFHYFCVLFYVV